MIRSLRTMLALPILAAMLAAFAFPVAAADTNDDCKAAEKRAKIQQNTREALDALFKESPQAKEPCGKAYGCAAFSNTKVSLGLTGGGGAGGAVVKGSGKHACMRMELPAGDGGVHHADRRRSHAAGRHLRHQVLEERRPELTRTRGGAVRIAGTLAPPRC